MTEKERAVIEAARALKRASFELHEADLENHKVQCATLYEVAEVASEFYAAQKRNSEAHLRLWRAVEALDAEEG